MQLKNNFIFACNDYLYLIEKGYSINSSLKLVGDHYRLNKIERNIILRGVTKKSIVDIRRSKSISADLIKGKNIFIDGYNFLFTISNYYLGNFCFKAMDGFIRDCANIGGRNKKKLFFENTVEILVKFYYQLKPKKITIYLDEPVSKSKDDTMTFKDCIEKAIKIDSTKKINSNSFNFQLVKNPDIDLSLINKPSVVITSDSVILDKTNAFIFDIVNWYFDKINVNLFSLEKINLSSTFGI